MGQCCSNQHHVLGEEFVSHLLQNPSLKLRFFTYNKLLNEIVSKRVQQEIKKKHIDELLIPQFYDTTSKDNTAIYYKNIFNYILTQLQEVNNMYIVILYFYPFINHEGEKCEETMYGIFQYISQKLTVQALEDNLLKYITFCTQGLTYAIWNKCDDPNIVSALDELNTNVYNSQNIKRFVDQIMFDIKRNSNGTNSIVNKEDFNKILLKWDISSAESIRAMMTSGFS